MAIVTIAMLLVGGATSASEKQEAENASNPLAKTRNTDLRYQYFDLRDGSDRHDTYIDGAFMANEKLKINYQLH